jgi:hypothetical protein
MFPVTQRSADLRSLSAPLVGWVAADNSCMIAVASRNAYQAGLRWTPCLHSDADCLDGGKSFETVIYIMPADMAMLTDMYRQDFPDAPPLEVGDRALWPYSKGTLLDGFETPDTSAWHVEGGSMAPYTPLKSWTWVSFNNGPPLPEAITEGEHSAIVQIPAGQGEVVLTRTVKIDQTTGPVSHIAIDAINRTGEASAEKTVRMTATVSLGDLQVARQPFEVPDRSNRRLLLPLDYGLLDGDPTIELRFERRSSPQRIVLDNLRGFGTGFR